MAKAKAAKIGSKLDLENLSEKDRDFLMLNTKDVMKMYKVDKQAVYDRRHFIKKRAQEANLNLQDILNKKQTKAEPAPKAAPVIDIKAAPKKRGRKPKVSEQAPKVEEVTKSKIEPKVRAKVEPKVEAKMEPKVEAKMEPKVESKVEPKAESKVEPKIEPKTEPVAEPKPEVDAPDKQREVVKFEKNIPVIMKPIEINFENFSLKLNGVPKKISVNPDTNAIEIDL